MISQSRLAGLRSAIAPVTGLPALPATPADTSLSANVIGWPALSSRDTSTHQDQAPCRSPIDALPWRPEKRSSLPYSLKRWLNAASFRCASNFLGMRVWKSTTAPTEPPGYTAENGP